MVGNENTVYGKSQNGNKVHRYSYASDGPRFRAWCFPNVVLITRIEWTKLNLYAESELCKTCFPKQRIK